ncbi:hypothetical protein DL770_004324 [Monosporascus sp. CRB-9-2]|nr:hypothetical protein DL770_004324 [Monosporascus sp. CRB-9-2]
MEIFLTVGMQLIAACIGAYGCVSDESARMATGRDIYPTAWAHLSEVDARSTGPGRGNNCVTAYSSGLFGFKSYGWDQLRANRRNVIVCIRWESGASVTEEQRDQVSTGGVDVQHRHGRRGCVGSSTSTATMTAAPTAPTGTPTSPSGSPRAFKAAPAATGASAWAGGISWEPYSRAACKLESSSEIPNFRRSGK